MKESNPVATQAEQIVAQCLDQCANDIAISPAQLAHCARQSIDPQNQMPIIGAYLANLGFRQIARKLLRYQFDPIYDDQSDKQQPLFEGLQDRYPCLRNDQHQYVKLHEMTLAEGEYNIARLRQEATSKLKHADALEAYFQAQAATG